MSEAPFHEDRMPPLPECNRHIIYCQIFSTRLNRLAQPRTKVALRQLEPQTFGQAAGRAQETPAQRAGIEGKSLLLISRFIPPVQQCQALPARHRVAIVRGNAFHLRSMRRFPVARITQDHAMLVEGVQVAFLSFVSGHGLHPKGRRIRRESDICSELESPK